MPKGAGPEWMNLSRMIKTHSKGHFLYIFDSCDVGHLALTPGPEFLAAASWNGNAYGSFFTNTLANQFEFHNGRPATVAAIFAKFNRNSKPHLLSPPINVLPEKSEQSITLQRLKPTTKISRLMRLQIDS